MADQPTAQQELLYLSLEAAVPLQAAAMRRHTPEQLLAVGASCAQEIAERGDVLQFGSKRRGEAARAFNALARGIAAGVMLTGRPRRMGPLIFEPEAGFGVRVRREE